MWIIDDNHEHDKILERTLLRADLDKYELIIDLPMESPSVSSHEYTGIGMAPTLDTGSTSGLAPHEGSLRELRFGLDPCQESFRSFPIGDDAG